VAAAGASSAALAHAGVASRWIGRQWPGSNRSRVKPHELWLNRGLFLKETTGFLNIACWSFHLERFLQISPEFYV
jgi:hypothetical protein